MGTVAIYVNRNGQQLGPYEAGQVVRLLMDGELSPEDYGWHKGLEEWKPLGQLDALTNPPTEETTSKHIAEGASMGPVRHFETSHLTEIEFNIQSVGTTWYVLALLFGIVGAPLLLYSIPRGKGTLTLIGFALLAAAFFYGFLGGGIRKNKSWAKVLSLIGAIVLMPFVPIGTIAGLYVLSRLKRKSKTPPPHS